MESCDLNDREQARDDQSGGDEVLGLFLGQVGASGASKDNWGSDEASKHGQGVLEAKQQGEYNRNFVVQAEKGSCLRSSSHERDVRGEEEGVVVVAEEAILGEERVLQSTGALAHGLLVPAIFWDDLRRSLILIHVVGQENWRISFRRRQAVTIEG